MTLAISLVIALVALFLGGVWIYETGTRAYVEKTKMEMREVFRTVSKHLHPKSEEDKPDPASELGQSSDALMVSGPEQFHFGPVEEIWPELFSRNAPS